MYIRERRNISKRIKLFFKKKEVFLDSQREIYKGRRATQRDRCARHEFTGATDAVRLVTTCPSIIFYTQPPSLFLPVFFSLCSLSLISFFFFFFFLVVVLSFYFPILQVLSTSSSFLPPTLLKPPPPPHCGETIGSFQLFYLTVHI